ncbi:MAG: ribosome-recycling factor [Thermonema sp.]|uniref:ribosome recycling factor n=1 Tax=Thermonema TaxID=28194 RepID=UPI00056E2F12|nr:MULTISPECIES: ribosome recycling factor [Thermonema]GIV40149.1 MAG: ribosome-recycling factor [Thermonema sp.]
MEEEILMYLQDAEERMKKALDHTQDIVSKIRAGRVTPEFLEGITVEYYGAQVPLTQVANVNSLDGRTLSIRPFEKGLINDIEKAIQASDLGVNPQNNGESIILAFPPLTEERRKQLVKQVKQEIEEGKISVRNIRKEANNSIKKLKEEGIPEDSIKRGEEEVQKLTDKYVAKLDELFEKKEQEIMKV